MAIHSITDTCWPPPLVIEVGRSVWLPLAPLAIWGVRRGHGRCWHCRASELRRGRRARLDIDRGVTLACGERDAADTAARAI